MILTYLIFSWSRKVFNFRTGIAFSFLMIRSVQYRNPISRRIKRRQENSKLQNPNFRATPNRKSQIPRKSQAPSPKYSSTRLGLVFGLVFSWDLEFGIFALRVRPVSVGRDMPGTMAGHSEAKPIP